MKFDSLKGKYILTSLNTKHISIKHKITGFIPKYQGNTQS